MKNKDQWSPTKFVYRKGKLEASRDKRNVALSSRLMADLVAKHYDTFLAKFVHGRLIDLGCGRVPLYAAYRDLATDVTCADWSDADGKNIHLDMTCDLNQTLPFDTASFDTVVLSDVMEHLYNPALLWSEISRILSPRGILLMNVPFFYPIHEAPHDYFRYTEFALKNFAKLSGMNIIVLKAIGGAPEILTDFLSKNLLRVPLIGKATAWSMQASCSLFLKTGIGKRVSEKTAVKFPFGYFLVAEKSL